MGLLLEAQWVGDRKVVRHAFSLCNIGTDLLDDATDRSIFRALAVTCWTMPSAGLVSVRCFYIFDGIIINIPFLHVNGFLFAE